MPAGDREKRRAEHAIKPLGDSEFGIASNGNSSKRCLTFAAVDASAVAEWVGLVLSQCLFGFAAYVP